MNTPKHNIFQQLPILINYKPIFYHEKSREPSYSTVHKSLFFVEHLEYSRLSIRIFSNQKHIIPSSKSYFDYEKPKQDLLQKVCNVYFEHQRENWDGYGAEPMKYLSQSLEFAKILSSEMRILIESIDIVPENDGCLCFEWFKSNNQLISISVKNDKLIYNYKIADEEGYGETNFSGKQMLIEQIKKVI